MFRQVEIPGLRKTPTQSRGWKRVEAILAAAAELFGDVGYEATSMEAIATAAGTSIGSVYQFFEKKQDVFVAIAHRCLEDTRVLATGFTSEATAALPVDEVLDAAVDAFVALGHQHPGVRALNRNLQLYGLFEAADEAMLRELAASTADFLRTRDVGLDEAAARRVGLTIVTTVNSVAFFAQRSTPDEATALVEESKRMLRAYVGTYLAE